MIRHAWLLLAITSVVFTAEPSTPEDRAIAFLAREVPAWHAENRCYSCHNNGDGARVLYIAHRLGWTVPAESLRDTDEWLSVPSGWENNRGDQSISDKKLARLQFAAALVEGVESRIIQDRKTRTDAAAIIARDQHPDGSWQVDSETSAGSPITYGAALATAAARNVLIRADAGHFQSAIARAGDWLRQLPVNYVPEAAGVLLGLPDEHQRLREMIEFLRKTQAGNGGWGPALHSPAEPFDTALALIALENLAGRQDVAAMTSRGRSWLIGAQLPSGAWPETTRPAGGQSYAQRISTTAWATLALIVTSRHQDRNK